MTEELQGRILLVDDDDLFRRALAERLKADGFEVTDVAEGAEAVRLVRGTPGLDTVVLDLHMPGLDGEATLAEVKRFRPELPVVVLTGHGSVESAMDMGSRGVYRYLEKPADPDHLVRVLRRARREKVHAMARQDMPVPSRPSRWGRLIGSNNHRPLIIGLGALLILLCAVIPPPQQLVDLVSAKKTAPVAGAPADLHVGYSEYRAMAVGESIADRYSKLCSPVGTDEGGGVHSALDGPATARKAQVMIGLIFTAALFWASGAVPIGITALIVASVMYGFGIMRPDKIAQAFAKDSVLFIFGVLAFSRVITRTGLDRRIGTRLLAPVRSLPVLLFFLLPIFSLACSFISESVLIAVMMPLLLMVYHRSIAERGLEVDRNMVVLFALMLCYTASIGGPGSPAAGGRNAVMIGILGDYGDAPSFADWMRYGLPFVPVATLAAATYFLIAFRKTVFGVKLDISATVRSSSATLGPTNREERITGLVFAGVVVLWITASGRLGMGGPVLLGLVALSVLRVLKWSEVTKIHWEVVFLYAGASAVGKALALTGGALFLAEGFVSILPDFLLTAAGLPIAASILAGVTTNFMSDGATVAALGPITVPMAQAAGLHPWSVGLATAFASSFAHLLIIGTPSNALVYAMCKDPLTGQQLVRQKDFLRHGAVIFCMNLVILWFWVFLGYWKWIGFPASG